MTVGQSAALLCRQYTLESSSEGSDLSSETSRVSQTLYNVPDVSGAFSSLQDAVSVDFSSITNLGAYARDQHTLSQSSAFSLLQSIAGSLGTAVYRSGTLRQFAAALLSQSDLASAGNDGSYLSYLSQKLSERDG